MGAKIAPYGYPHTPLFLCCLRCLRGLPHPHLLYPQFKQVAHPSMITSALVLHLWHIVALGGKLVPSPVTSTSSSWWEDVATEPSPSRPSPAGAGEGAAATSGFFFERDSYCLRFSAIRAFWAALIC